MGSNGWRDGTDHLLRYLRFGTTIAFLAVFVLVALDPGRDATSAAVILGLAMGGVLILVGYGGVVRLPIIGRDEDEEGR